MTKRQDIARTSGDARAREEGEAALVLAEQIGDRQAICESRLLLAEAHLHLGDTDETALQLQKVAEQHPVKVDVRVVAATNCDLEQMVAERRFISRAARDLGLTRRGLQLKLGRYEIDASHAA